MSALDIAIEAAAAACVERRLAELQRPLLVHQRNVERVVGIAARDFLRLARNGSFPCTHERRLVVAKTDDVVAFFARSMTIAEREPETPAPESSEARCLARVGARRVA